MDLLQGQYGAHREWLNALHVRLMDALPPAVVRAAAGALGMVQGGQLTYQDEGQLAAFYDYAMYLYAPGGRTVVQAHLAADPAGDPPLRAAMDGADYVLFRVDGRLPSGKVQATDLLRDEPLLLVDPQLAQAAGMTAAATLLRLPEFAMTTGAPLSLQRRHLAGLEGLAGADLAAALIRRKWSSDAPSAPLADELEGRTPGALLAGLQGVGAPRDPRRMPARKPAKNAPCPCGSGKRYKACCGKRG